MAKKDASIIHSLEIKLKESKLVISDKNKKMKEMGERDAAIIHSLKKDLLEKENTIKALERKLAEKEKEKYIVTI